MMSSNFWYLDRDHTQRGPVAEDEFVRLIRQGVITRETMMWTAGMGEWRPAGQVPSVSALFGGPAPAIGAGAPVVGTGAPAVGPALGPLGSAIPVWGFFWRSVVTLIGVVLIIPAPWVGPWFYKWLCERISLPDGRPLTFSGKPGDIWYVFVAWGALMWIGQLKEGRFELVTIALSWILGVLLLKWACAHASTPDERLKLSFEGGYLPYIGWNILLALSAITIIGWAWVMKYMLRWICQNVRGTAEFAFTGTGLEILWRTVVVVLLSILIIPIPWMMRWYTQWMFSQVAVRTEA
jgi:GYF domain 2